MRALHSLLALAAFLPALAAAQVTPPGLEGERLAAYDAARLYIEGIAVTPVNAAGVPVGRPRFSWSAYRGNERISEIAFYDLTGQEELASRARARRGRATTMVVLGTLALAAGTAALMLSESTEDVTRVVGEPPFSYTETERIWHTNYPLAIAGGTVATAGIVSFSLGVPLFGRRVTHAQAAHEMTERYNAGLAEMLVAPPPPPATIDG